MCLGIPGKIVEITDTQRKLGLVDIMGVRREVNLVCVARTDQSLAELIGQWVLVHVGFAMSRIDAVEAARTLEILHALGEAQAAMSELKAAT